MGVQEEKRGGAGSENPFAKKRSPSCRHSSFAISHHCFQSAPPLLKIMGPFGWPSRMKNQNNFHSLNNKVNKKFIILPTPNVAR